MNQADRMEFEILVFSLMVPVVLYLNQWYVFLVVLSSVFQVLFP
jgi:hypothetical protein